MSAKELHELLKSTLMGIMRKTFGVIMAVLGDDVAMAILESVKICGLAAISDYRDIPVDDVKSYLDKAATKSVEFIRYLQGVKRQATILPDEVDEALEDVYIAMRELVKKTLLKVGG